MKWSEEVRWWLVEKGHRTGLTGRQLLWGALATLGVIAFFVGAPAFVEPTKNAMEPLLATSLVLGGLGLVAVGVAQASR